MTKEKKPDVPQAVSDADLDGANGGLAISPTTTDAGTSQLNTHQSGRTLKLNTHQSGRTLNINTHQSGRT